MNVCGCRVDLRGLCHTSLNDSEESGEADVGGQDKPAAGQSPRAGAAERGEEN